MTGNIKTAFGEIKAEDALKTNTFKFLQGAIQKREQAKPYARFRRFAVALACLVFIILPGFFSYQLYFTPSAYVDVDVNPSLALTLNRFDRVIDAYAYNPDGEAVLEASNVRHKKYNDAIGILIDIMLQKGFAPEDSLISVTLQTNNGDKEPRMLSVIQSAVRNHHSTARIEAFTVGDQMRNAAYTLNLSPAKYLAIQELIEVDPTVTVDGCKHRSIIEIRQMTERHSGNHHGAGQGHNNSNHSSGSNNRTP